MGQRHLRNHRFQYLQKVQTMIHIQGQRNKAPKFTQGRISQTWALTTSTESNEPCTEKVYKGLVSTKPTFSGARGSLTSLFNIKPTKAVPKIQHQSVRNRLTYKRKYAPMQITRFYSRPDIVPCKQDEIRVARSMHARGELSCGVSFAQPQGYWDWLYWNNKDEYYKLKYDPSTNALDSFCKVCDKTNGELLNPPGVCDQCLMNSFR